MSGVGWSLRVCSLSSRVVNMKIQCDVCNKRDASLFCTADEAALCDTCDHRIHDANKLASKHQRFSLNHPAPNNSPLCDICLERRGFIFCQEDRAILCKDCDYPIHAANQHTKNHNRFLLTGIKISLHSLPPPLSNSNSNSMLTASKGSVDSLSTVNKANEESGNFTSSSISEYLINTIPGWQFEDFIDSPSVPFAGGDAFSPSDNLVSFSTDGMWVPQAPSMDQQQKIAIKESNKNGRRNSKLRDDNFIVPQISPSTPTPNKRSRFLW